MENLKWIIMIKWMVVMELIRKVEAIQVCQKERMASIYKSLESLNCGSKEYENWKIMFYKRNIKEYQTKVKGLKIVKRTCKTETSFRI